MKPMIIIGRGGHAQVLHEIIREGPGQILGVVDRQPGSVSSREFELPILGDDSILDRYSPCDVELINGVGSVGDTFSRKEVFIRLKKQGFVFVSIIHPKVVVASNVEMGEGTQIMAGVIIQPGISIGCNVLLNTSSSIDHDCVIHDHVHVAPGVVLSGGVVIEEGVHLGVGAVVSQNIRIGKDTTIGAGAVVLKDVPERVVAWGVPAKVKRFK